MSDGIAGRNIACRCANCHESLRADLALRFRWWQEHVCPGLRVREVVKEGFCCLFLLNEVGQAIDFKLKGQVPSLRIDRETGASSVWSSAEPIRLAGYETVLLGRAV